MSNIEAKQLTPYEQPVLPDVLPIAVYRYQKIPLWGITSPSSNDGKDLSPLASLSIISIILSNPVISRRDFLKLAATATGALVVSGCTVVNPKICEDAIPHLPDVKNGIDQEEYDRKTNRQKAKFLLEGGYISQWRQVGVAQFINLAQAESARVIPTTVCEIAGLCNPENIDEEIILTDSVDNFIRILEELGIPSESEAANSEESAQDLAATSKGITGVFTVTENGVKKEVDRKVMNFHILISDDVMPYFQATETIEIEKDGNLEYTEITVPDYQKLVLAISTTVLHEFMHLPGTGNYTPEQIADLTTALREVSDNVKAFDVWRQYSFLGNDGFEIKVDNGNYEEKYLFGTGLNEVMRAKLQRVIENKLGIFQTSWDEHWSYYNGERILTHLNDKLRLSDEEFLLLMIGFKNGNTSDSSDYDPPEPSYQFNYHHLLEYYQSRAATYGNNLSKGDIMTLFAVINSKVLEMQEINVSDEPLAEITCGMEKSRERTISYIDGFLADR